MVLYRFTMGFIYYLELLLLLRRHYSQMRTFPSLMDYSQSALLFYLSFQYIILHLLISVCTQFHHLFFGLFITYQVRNKYGCYLCQRNSESGSYTLTATLYIEFVIYVWKCSGRLYSMAGGMRCLYIPLYHWYIS
jgi:hypothetical protein